MTELRIQAPVPPLLHDILQQVSQAAAMLGLDFFVGGALARDIMLTHVFGQKVARATRDVDLGLYVKDWDEFERLKQHLQQSGRFVADKHGAQRLLFDKAIPLDLIPFGHVSADGQSISWPPKHDVVLNVAGFADAFASSIRVDVGHGLRVKTCSLPALAVLKLIAWKDRGRANNKDATDFLLIASTYGPAISPDRLYETETALLLQFEGDIDLAGAMLLGKDAAVQCEAGTAEQVRSILEDAALRRLLIDQLARPRIGLQDDADVLREERMVDAFHSGFISGAGNN